MKNVIASGSMIVVSGELFNAMNTADLLAPWSTEIMSVMNAGRCIIPRTSDGKIDRKHTWTTYGETIDDDGMIVRCRVA